ncbi:prenyltransferase, partial [Streptomyces tendae]
MSRAAAAARDTAGPPGAPAASSRPPAEAAAAPGAASGTARPPLATAEASPRSAHLGAWAELLRLPALFTVPGDALAGA